VFANAADIYAAARPDYPERVYDILRERCGLAASSRIVEIGAGTGQATKRFLGSGAHVVAVEPTEAFAEQLRSTAMTTERLEVVVAAFEDADLPTASFDLVAAATSFHWLDPDRALPKIHSILRPGGAIGFWWNVFGDPGLADAFHDATEPLLRDLASGPSEASRGPFALDVPARAAELTRHGFHDIDHDVIAWTLVLGASEARQLYATFSKIARLPDAERARILDEIERIALVEFDGRVERRMLTPVYTARRT
jgi:SAM-dependent methyltransferase